MKGRVPAWPERRHALGFACVLAAAVTTALTTLGTGPGWLLARDVGVVLTFLAAALHLAVRARASRRARHAEVSLWRSLSWAFGVLVVASAVELVLLHATDAPAEVAVGVAGFVGALAFGAMYQGLIRWNRVEGVTADPGDWLNGLAAVLVAVALGNLVLDVTGPLPDGASWWVLQGALLRLAGAVIVLGTVISLTGLAGLVRDRRLWLVALALVALVAGELSFVVVGAGMGSTHHLTLAWAVATVGVSAAAAAGVPASRVRPATTLAPTIGALVVLAVSAGVLLVDGRLAVTAAQPLSAQGSGTAVVLAVAAGLLAGVRVGRLVIDLVHLAQSRHEARTDELTGVANRRALMEHLADALARRRDTALLVLDLDRFTEVNDRYGHTAGDALLRFVADRLVGTVAGTGFVARLGGDEFAVVVTVSQVEARFMGERLAVVAGSRLELDGRRLRAHASVGVAQAPADERVEADELLRRANAALARAKATASGVDCYDEEIDRAARERARLLEELRRLLGPARSRGHDLVVHYQPQVDLVTGAVRGVEALVRWQHPRHGLLSPAQFIALAEQEGLMGPLTSRVLRQAAADAVAWRADGVHLRVSVNLAASFLADPDLLPLLDDTLRTTGLPSEDLVLEVTETTLMDDPERGLAAARAIRARGVGLSIDDYGTGYSSLSYLSDLPATELKLDRSFTQRVLGDERTRAIVAATVDLAHRIDLRIIAEGVEDEPTLVALRTLGCDEVQGFVHSRPRPAGEFLTWLGDREDLAARHDAGTGRP